LESRQGQPSSSPSGPPRKRILTNSVVRTPTRAIVITGVGAPSAKTETAIVARIIARGSARATITHMAEARAIERPSNSRRRCPPPRTAERMSAVMLGPDRATMFSTAPPDVSMPSDIDAMPHQIAHEIAKVRATKARI